MAASAGVEFSQLHFIIHLVSDAIPRIQHADSCWPGRRQLQLLGRATKKTRRMRKQTKTIGVVSPTRRECRARTNKRETVWKWRHTRIVMKYRSIGWNKRGRATADDQQDVYILHCAFYSFETSPEGVAKSCGPHNLLLFILLPGNGRRREEAGRGLCDRFFKLV